MDMPQKRRRRVELMIDARMLGFLKPTPISGPISTRRKRDSLEFLAPPSTNQQNRPHDQAS